MRAIIPICLAALVPVGAGACAPRPVLDPRPSMAVTADLLAADSLVAEGCYRCLQDALVIYERLDATGDAPAAGRRAIDVSLLLAMRERELGLGSGKALEHAVDLAGRQPAPYDVGVFLSVADVQLWHTYGVSNERAEESMRPLRKMFRTWQGWRAELLPGTANDLLRAYFLLALDCSARPFFRDQGVEPWPLPAGAPPLLQYRAAICPGASGDAALDALSVANPRWAEAEFFLGEAALARLTVRTAEKHLVKALAGIPDLAAAQVLLGHVYLATEEYQMARAAYHRANAAVPGRREAMLGEAKSASFLGRHEDAIVILDEMVRLGTWFMGETHYWRAWNRYRLQQYDAANDDVLASRNRLPMDGQVDKLAGFIALARNEVPRAEAEFRAAVGHIEGRGGSDCDARYYLGSAQVLQRKWADAVPNFEAAEPCYVLTGTALRKRILDIRKSDLPDDRQDVLVAAKEKDIAAARLQEARSAFNAGAALANLGDLEKARPCAERAAAHPELAAQAKTILDRIGKF
ncbi:MAG: putative system TPR-repeat lipoprotein [Acidobacteria bacterium]|nr:putative system TPR-repeat lipoprotein [Acidobacteriota bacterium]